MYTCHHLRRNFCTCIILYFHRTINMTRDQDPVFIPLDISLSEVSELSSEFQSFIEHVDSFDHRLESHNMVGKTWHPT
ncbi:hypothetical protein BDR03DRAFT_959988 [Suillus americanus]|nr:hypothetical protein BDR03DRAFT_959988 [Suillus americanus]